VLLAIQAEIEGRHFAEADRLLAEAEARFPSDPGLANLRGVVAAQQGDYTAAELNFQEAVKHAPRFTAAYLNLGRLYQERAPADPQVGSKALGIYQRVLGYDPGNNEANYQSAVLLLQEGQYQRSLDHLLRLPAETQASAQALSVLSADHAALGHR